MSIVSDVNREAMSIVMQCQSLRNVILRRQAFSRRRTSALCQPPPPTRRQPPRLSTPDQTRQPRANARGGGISGSLPKSRDDKDTNACSNVDRADASAPRQARPYCTGFSPGGWFLGKSEAVVCELCSLPILDTNACRRWCYPPLRQAQGRLFANNSKSLP